jgi:hypothetical protein
MGKSPWFEICRWYRHAPEALRCKSSMHWTYLRIARLPNEIGQALDEVRPPLRAYRFIAWASRKEGVKRRHALVMRLRALHGRWPTDWEMYSAESPEADAEGPPSSTA